MASFELAADLVGSGVSVNAIHPVQEGLDAVWRLLTDPALDGVSGHYFHGTQDAQPDPQADDPAA